MFNDTRATKTPIYVHFIELQHVSISESVPGKESGQREMFEVNFLGSVPDIVISGSHTRDREAQLVDRVEEAQVM